MKDLTTAFVTGIVVGFIITGCAITFLVTTPRQEEAIKRGYAEMKLEKPTDTKAVFTWK